MRLSLTIEAPGRASTDVLVDADDRTPVKVVRKALAQRLGVETDDGLWVGSSRLDDKTALVDTALRNGTVLATCRDAAAEPFVPSTRGWQLHVVSGRDSGSILDLPIGTHRLGRAQRPPLRDPLISRKHAELVVDGEGATLKDCGSANGTRVDGEPVNPDGPGLPVRPGQLVEIGDTQLVIVAATPPDAAAEPKPGGVTEFTRPPRILPSGKAVKVTLPQAPTERSARKFPWATMLVPLVLGVVMAQVMHAPMYLLFALMSPIMALSNAITDRRQNKKSGRSERATYVAEMQAAHAQLGESLEQETARRRNEHPDAASVVLTATKPTRRLWERRRTDYDALDLRVGTADLPSYVELTQRGGSREDAERRTVYAVPAIVSMHDAGVLGLAGPQDDVRGLARWLVLQLVVHHAPRDLALTLVAPKSGTTWNWIRWLPHSRPADGDGAFSLVGNDPDTIAARVGELAALVKARKEAAKGVSRAAEGLFPAHVLVIDGARSLRMVPGLTQVLQDGASVGVFAICTETEERYLPEECSATVVFSGDDPARVAIHRSSEDAISDVLAEQVSEPIASTIARALAPVVDVTPDEQEVALPDAARLLDVLGMEPPTANSVRARWQLEGRTTRVPIGVGTDGTFAIDISRDGPHGLIAGTTGSGKSELLQTMIASLAVANRPDAMNFVLVDYKGGSAFKDCVALPHTVGMVTDLNAHLVERALVSLGAELKRREHQLAAAGAKDIEDYTDLMAKQRAMTPMPRLLIVIDEFASMARELPDFVTGLVNIAQRGRSLGIHLLLATQRPSGVVSPEIRANTNLRISLRVTDAADSSDVLEAADAARIPKSAPGRGYARLGHGALVPFQAGRVGGRRPDARPTKTPAPFVTELGWTQLGYPPPASTHSEGAGDVEVTDLSVLVEAVQAAAKAQKVPAQRTPWLPALPEAILVSDLPGSGPALGELPPIPFGVQDLPAEQVQQAAALDLGAHGHLLVVGSSRSGRSQLLRTLAGVAADTISTADLHMFGIDCGNGALLPLGELPHCGAVVSRTQTERVIRMLDRLSAELERRQATLSESGFADISEQRRAVDDKKQLPHILFFIDRWDGFTSTLGELDGGRLTEAVLNMLREGGSAGIHMVITGDRSLASGRIGSLSDNKLALRLADKGDYGFLGLNARNLPDDVPPGRGFAADTGIETQVALLAEDSSGQGQAAALGEIAARAAKRDAQVGPGRRPFRVDVLPSRITFEAASAMRPATAGAMFAMVGVGGDELSAVGPDLSSSAPAFIVTGPAKSGRSTALVVMTRSLLLGGTTVIIGAPRPSPLRDLAGNKGVIDVITEVDAGLERWQQALSNAGGRPVVVVLDDAESMRDCPPAELFRSIIKGAMPEQALILSGHIDGLCAGLSGWQVDAKKARQGVLLSPQGSADGDLIGVRLPRSAVGQPVQPGRALIHLGDGQLSTIIIPSA
jgi:S-DNA-T family DNA segregation ATPase FtsK/SpoIIIE